MRTVLLLGASLAIGCSAAAHALVGKSDPAGTAVRHTVMVLKRQSFSSGFCSGVMIARSIVLTAAHCVKGAQGVAIYLPGNGAPKLNEALSIAIHPGYVRGAIRSRKRSIDLALVRTRAALPAGLQPVAISSINNLPAGTRLRIAGFGLRREGDERSAGQLRSAQLVVREPVSAILLWMRSAAGGAGGACTGDSGGPIFTQDFSSLTGITVWARGSGKRSCGQLTQAIKLAPQRAWIYSVLRKWGAQ